MTSGGITKRKSMFFPIVLFGVAWFLIWVLSVVPNDAFLLGIVALAAAGFTAAALMTGLSRLHANS